MPIGAGAVTMARMQSKEMSGEMMGAAAVQREVWESWLLGGDDDLLGHVGQVQLAQGAKRPRHGLQRDQRLALMGRVGYWENGVRSG